ncbi:MAG: nicotinate phosphoribosyltransferase, partial [Cyanobacteria bacterium HKST-UBA01]|nr:nicotinate phosphoribosyltransferase [Cyanobacteria bacterium HKST-UBA01]
MVLGNAFRNCQDHALLTDLYELTMAYAYWKSGSASKEAVFHLSFRKNPFEGGYAVFCGLQQV